MDEEQHKVVAIVGGGFSGTVLAARLLQTSEKPLRILLFDRTGRFGAGLAYSTDAPEHLLNVPASKMSALSDAPTHFADWLKKENLPGCESPETSFVPRRHYRAYLQELLRLATANPRNLETQLDLITDEVIAIDSNYVLQTRSGALTQADAVVLTTGYLAASNLKREFGGRICFRRPYEPETWPVDGIPDVVIVGSRLTALDAVLSVFARYPTARVTVVSSTGYVPGLHVVEAPRISVEVPASLLGIRQIVKWLRTEVRNAEDHGLPWQSVFDAMRSQWEPIWQRLSPRDKERFLEHLVRHFDRFRHRVSAEIAQVFRARIEAGTLSLIAGRVQGPTQDTHGVIVCQSDGRVKAIKADLAIDCSGASMSWVRSDDALFRQLFDRRRIVEGPHAMGIVADTEGRIIDADGRTGDFFAIGPVLRGVRWETTAVHDIRHQVDQVARAILA